jgi:hypothetical protein
MVPAITDKVLEAKMFYLLYLHRPNKFLDYSKFGQDYPLPSSVRCSPCEDRKERGVVRGTGGDL